MNTRSTLTRRRLLHTSAAFTAAAPFLVTPRLRGVAGPAGADHRAVRRRRTGRRDLAHFAAAACRGAEGKLLRREQAGRGGQHRRRPSRARRAGRLHRVDHLQHDHDQSAALQERALRPREGFHPAGRSGGLADRLYRQSEERHQDRRRVRRLREREEGRGELRPCRLCNAVTSSRRVLQEPCRLRDDARFPSTAQARPTRRCWAARSTWCRAPCPARIRISLPAR